MLKIRMEIPIDEKLTTYLDTAFDPPGLLALSAYLKQHLDCQTGFEIPPEEADYVFITATTPHFTAASKRAIEIVTSNRDVIVLMGGSHLTARPEDLPKYERIIGVIGEGEITTLEILKSRKTGSALGYIPGLCYTFEGAIHKTAPRQEIEDLDTLPMLDYSIMRQRVSLPLLTSRGCPYSCTFCASAARWKKFRRNSAEWIVDKIERIAQDIPECTTIDIYDDLFVSDKKRLATFVNGVKKFRHLHYRFTARANLFDQESCDLIKQLNLLSVSFGFESGSNRILKLLKQQAATVEMNHAAWKLCQDNKIQCNFSMIMGHPEETAEDLEASHRFIQEHQGGLISVSPLIPLPGTEIWKQYGVVPEDWSTYNIENVFSALKIHPDKELINRYLDMYPSFRHLDSIIVYQKPEDFDTFGETFRYCLIIGGRIPANPNWINELVKIAGQKPDGGIFVIGNEGQTYLIKRQCRKDVGALDSDYIQRAEKRGWKTYLVEVA